MTETNFPYGRCGTCASWASIPFAKSERLNQYVGNCWSADRLDGNFDKGDAGVTGENSVCEAYIERLPSLTEQVG